MYGDSYTFGKIPGGLRFDESIRFPKLIQDILGNEFDIVEEGLRGRMMLGENSFFPERDGLVQFGPILGSHLPLDLIVLMLGTNDCNSGSTNSAETISEAIFKYAERVEFWCNHLGFSKPEMLVVAPPKIKEIESYKAFKDIFKGSQNKIEQLPKLYKIQADKLGFEYLNADEIVEVSAIDGVHLDEENNRRLAVGLANKIKQILN